MHTHAVRPRLSNRIELYRTREGVWYQLDGQHVRNGDPLEVWTTLGWVKGTFAWEGEPYLPYVNVISQQQTEPFVIVTSSLCRWPEQTSDVA
jgi:hypothetical protein